jgi:hypothetical protein
MMLPVILQLYKLSEELQKEFEGTLEKIAALGYRRVELAGIIRAAEAAGAAHGTG